MKQRIDKIYTLRMGTVMAAMRNLAASEAYPLLMGQLHVDAMQYITKLFCWWQRGEDACTRLCGEGNSVMESVN